MQLPFANFITRLLLCAACLLAAGGLAAREFKLGAITVSDPHARTTVGGQSTGSAYLRLVNRGAADRLLSASTPVASAVEFHSMRMDGDVMRMRPLDVVELPAAASVILKPGAEHLMLTGLKAPLLGGSSFELTLVFEKAGAVKVQVRVEAAAAPAHQH